MGAGRGGDRALPCIPIGALMTAPAFDASQHGDALPLPHEFDATIPRLAWLSSLLIGDDLNWSERLIIKLERALVERTTRRSMKPRSGKPSTHQENP
jgi:hypothetical protein